MCGAGTLRSVSGALLTPRWLAVHALTALAFATCLGLSWWQFERAGAGSGRSLGYALQWPGFGVFVLGVWAWFCRDATRAEDPAAAPEPVPAGRVDDDVVLPPPRPTPAVADEDDDPELAAFNRLLASLQEKETR